MRTGYIAEGEFGLDSGNEFQIVNKRDGEIQIEYQDSGDVAWFQENRFERSETNGTLLLN